MSATKNIETTESQYECDGQIFKAFVAKPASAGVKPAVLIVHEWWGLNDYPRSRAIQVAEQGYVGIAIDLYGEGQQATEPDQAQALMEATFTAPELIPNRFDAAMAFAKSLDATDSNNIAAMGYCFGGAVVLNMARAGKDLKAIGSFHGLLETEAPLQQGVFNGKIGVYTGADDPMVNEDIVKAFQAEMDSAKADYEFIAYPDTVHGFTNPAATARGEKYSMPLKHSPEADSDSWHRMMAILGDVFAV